MILNQLLTVLALSAFTGSSNVAKDKFKNFHDQALVSTPLVLDEASYLKLTDGPRNHSVAVLLTAMDQRFGCILCKEFQPEWELLAKSWLKGDKSGKTRTVFGTLDFVNGKGVFQRLMLQTAPVLLVFRPTEGPGASPDGQPQRFDFTTGVSTAEPVHSWITRTLPDGPKPSFRRPPNYVKIVSVTTGVLGFITFISVLWPYMLPVIQNRNVWAAFSLLSILLFTSGHMFNHIRKVPYVGGNGKNIDYFAGGFSNQFGMETQIVAAMYGVLAFSAIALALKVPRIADPKQQQVAVILWTAVMVGMYSFLLSVFRVKNGGYPFWLPPF
ncbi:MAG: oligosaccharyl transferase subunit ost3/OST6 [Vezdaea aestivalis]|nr:MAG: oligosaccharyl transferase subunit ost3/OST6 [Vezdaea aestivalis]